MNTTSQEQQTVTFVGSLTLFAFLFLTSATYASEYKFVAEGAIKYQVLSFDCSVFVEQDDLFTVNVKNCKWHIKKTPTRFLKNGKEQPLAEYGIASSDSTNFYQVSAFKQIVSTQQQKRETSDHGPVNSYDRDYY
jgi:hypothetical protein